MEAATADVDLTFKEGAEGEAQDEGDESDDDKSGSGSGSSSSNGSGSGSDSDSDSDSESDSDSDSDSDYSDSDSDEDDPEAKKRRLEAEEKRKRIAAARVARLERVSEAMKHRNPEDLRCPIVCILGHVDTGKTKLLDKIRRTNVQDGEAGGITQQIGATYIPQWALKERTACMQSQDALDIKIPGLLVIDTPGHESFTNLRSRGSGLCDLAILVIDIMHGLEQQTLESLNLLRMRKTPFIIALNKVDRLYDWKTQGEAPIKSTMASQGAHVLREYDERLQKAILSINEQGLNAAVYYDNPDPRSFLSVVPTSAITGDGLPDLLQLLCKLPQTRMSEKLQFCNEVECTVLEVKMIEGLGTTVDVVLVNGTLREGQTLVLASLQGAVVTQIRALVTPQPMREMRVKGQYVHHKEIKGAQGVKIVAQGMETVLAGTQCYVLGPDDDVDELKDEVTSDIKSVLSRVDKSGEGVCVQASTLGSLEALLEFLKSPAVNIPVSNISIGPVNKRDVMAASVAHERKQKEFACILAFDVKVTSDAEQMANELNVRIFSADIIYHLFDQFTAYMAEIRDDRKKAAADAAVFPCRLKIIPSCVFCRKDPIVLGVEVMEGIARVGTPICIPSKDFITIGKIASMEVDHKSVEKAGLGKNVAMKIVSTAPSEAGRMYGRHFDQTDELVSHISRHSIDLVKEFYRDELCKDDWILMVKLKKLFEIP